MTDKLPTSIPDDWLQLVDAHCAGTLTEADARRLSTLLEENEQARLFYLAYLDEHAVLRWERRGPVAEPPRQRAAFSARHVLALAASILLLIGLASALLLIEPARVEGVATLTGTSAAHWAGKDAALAAGTPLPVGTLELEQGLAEITFARGAVLVLEAPARLELVDENKATLHFGRAVAHVPSAAVGFVIDTPRAALVDLGTEFGVGVAASGETQVQVFEGVVIAKWQGSQQRLTAGQAVSIAALDALPLPIPFVEQRFVRAFPRPGSKDPPAGPLYNRSRWDSVHVLPAPGQIVIDGALGDWDASGKFRSACVEPYASDYFVEGMMMYDAERLYIAAHVGDPHPLRNRRDPAMDSAWLWAGGSVIVRLATDRQLDWPLDAAARSVRSERFPLAGRRSQDRSDGIAHLVMWYHRPSGTPRLQLAFGMDFHDTTSDAVGWQGQFVPSANGRGYTLEYAIPWSLLRATQPPRAGDTLAASWNVHWSDADGLASRGYLAEIANPTNRPYLFANAATWGRAVYHAKGPLPAGTLQPAVPPANPR